MNSLKSISNRTQLIVYCWRTERQSGELTTNIYQELKEADRPVVSVVKDIESRKAALGEELEEKYSRLHQPQSLELKSFYVVLEHQGDKNNICRKKKRLSGRRRQNLKMKELSSSSSSSTVAPELKSPPCDLRIVLKPGQLRRKKRSSGQKKAVNTQMVGTQSWQNPQNPSISRHKILGKQTNFRFYPLTDQVRKHG